MVPPLGLSSRALLLAAAALLLLVGARAAPARPAPTKPRLPAMPAWAKLEPHKSWERNTSLAYNRKLAASANASGTVYDIVFMGDSLTSLTLWVAENVPVWESFWGAQSGLSAARMGVGGTTVEELTWRLMANGEKLAKDPRVVVLLVGINNQLPKQPAPKLDFLLNKYFPAAMPTTEVLVVAPLPSFRKKEAALAQLFRPIVKRCAQCSWSTCGSNLVPSSPTYFTDGLHLTPAGYHHLYSCLKPTVLSLLKKQKRPKLA
ncbi:Platelet-activating factor isoform gamma subunit [Chlorella sorokiniana]|uniref:Platelet-activating factor isoform gamma subunit n=1 Tax=Chlorella sorokiniana TaxID=3076 RepID=A0A2P6U1G2_CHLSO|nr:Platelet-activating factor isoform gamma subunit [Chlorella sorokiniana]|eukprot:PRW60156.1 Platelet-activating factor isoform gamma subunit [Chlorella sorokiniana]